MHNTKPYQSSEAEEQRCLSKDGVEATFTEEMKIEILRDPTASASWCVDACFQREACDSFQYDDYNHECFLLKGAYPNTDNHNNYMTSGWCPKGDKNYVKHSLWNLCRTEKLRSANYRRGGGWEGTGHPTIFLPLAMLCWNWAHMSVSFWSKRGNGGPVVLCRRKRRRHMQPGIQWCHFILDDWQQASFLWQSKQLSQMYRLQSVWDWITMQHTWGGFSWIPFGHLCR